MSAFRPKRFPLCFVKVEAVQACNLLMSQVFGANCVKSFLGRLNKKSSAACYSW